MIQTVAGAAAAVPVPYAMPSSPTPTKAEPTAIQVPQGPLTLANRCIMDPKTDISSLLATAYKVEEVTTSKGVLRVWSAKSRPSIWETERQQGVYLERTSDGVIVKFWRHYRDRRFFDKEELLTFSLKENEPYPLDRAAEVGVEHIVLSVLHGKIVLEEIYKNFLLTKPYYLNWKFVELATSCRQNFREVLCNVAIVYERIQKDFAAMVTSFTDVRFPGSARASLDTILVDPTTGNLWVWPGFHGQYRLETEHRIRIQGNEAFPRPLYLLDGATRRIFSGYPKWEVGGEGKTYREWEFSHEDPSNPGKYVTHTCRTQMGDPDKTRIIRATIDIADAVQLIGGDLHNINVTVITGKTAAFSNALGLNLSAYLTPGPVMIAAEYLFGFEISSGDSLTHHDMYFRHLCNLPPSLKPRRFMNISQH